MKGKINVGHEPSSCQFIACFGQRAFAGIELGRSGTL